MTVSDILATLHTIAPPSLALENDPIGLLIGDPTAAVAKVMVALDATLAVAEAAIAEGAQMIIAHHPLIYHPLKAVRADDPIGQVVMACVRGDIAVAAAHTNWDVAPGGINDVLADLLELKQVRPLQITHREPLVKIAVFVPTAQRETVFEAMAAAGAGAIGNYDRCAFWTAGTGRFRPQPGAQPFVGHVGEAETVSEDRLEMILPEAQISAVTAAMRAAHPYEQVAYDVYPLHNTAAEFGIGRIGVLPRAATADDLRRQLQTILRFDAVRLSEQEEKMLQTVAVCGGAGTFLLPDAIAAGADALITSDVRHHEFVEAAARNFCLFDAGHHATEMPGTRRLAVCLQEAVRSQNVSVVFRET